MQFIQKILMNLLAQIIKIKIFKQWKKIFMTHIAKTAQILTNLGKLWINKIHMGHPTLQCIQVPLSLITYKAFKIMIISKLIANKITETFKIIINFIFIIHSKIKIINTLIVLSKFYKFANSKMHLKIDWTTNRMKVMGQWQNVTQWEIYQRMMYIHKNNYNNLLKK